MFLIFKQLSELFTPDDAIVFSPWPILEFDHYLIVSQFKELLSIDGYALYHYLYILFQFITLHEAHWILTTAFFISRKNKNLLTSWISVRSFIQHKNSLTEGALL